MRVCFFNRSYWPDFGATGQLLAELAEDLVAHHGCEVTVVTGYPLHGREGLPPREVRRGVEIVRAAGTTFHPRRFAGRAANYLTYFASACAAGLRIPPPDVVVALTDPPIIGLAALLAARRHGARFVFLCQDVFPEVAVLVEEFRSRGVHAALARVNRILVEQADAVVALGDTMKRRLVEGKGARAERVTVIHNWADCTALTPGPKDNAFARAHGLHDRFVVMHAGNIGLSQNLDVLLEAAGRLRAYDGIRFVLVGDGSRRAALEARARERGLHNVMFLPYQPREAMGMSYAAADLFLVSLEPGLAGCIVPSKVYGILAAGRPYVAAVEEACEVAAITAQYACGFVVPPGDANALASRILDVYRDKPLAARLGRRAREAAPAFDRKRQTAAYAALLRHVASSADGPADQAQPATAECRPPTAECRAPNADRRMPTAECRLPNADRRGRTFVTKRAFDVCLAAAGLVVSAPLWALVALAIRLEDGGPVFFTQPRVGLGGRPFRACKFRSMVPGAASAAPRQAGEDDPRVTRVGRVLRATALDELPQLWNILRGDMSFVGPRPLVPGEIEVHGDGRSVPLEAFPGYNARHSVRPGLTGLTQVFAPRDIRLARKFRVDLLYVRRASLWLDVRLVALSFWITFRARWEHRGPKL